MVYNLYFTRLDKRHRTTASQRLGKEINQALVVVQVQINTDCSITSPAAPRLTSSRVKPIVHVTTPPTELLALGRATRSSKKPPATSATFPMQWDYGEDTQEGSTLPAPRQAGRITSDLEHQPGQSRACPR